MNDLSKIYVVNVRIIEINALFSTQKSQEDPQFSQELPATLRRNNYLDIVPFLQLVVLYHFRLKIKMNSL